MSDVDVHGPIDYLIMEFDGDGERPETVAAVLDLIDRGIVRLYDLAIIRKGADGAVAAVVIDDSAELGPFASFAGAQTGLLSDEDVIAAGEVLSTGCTGVILVFENLWARPFVAAALKEGGTPIASARIPATDVVDALDALGA
jgi:hypothetical protein